MSLNSKNKSNNILSQKYDGSREGFEVFNCAVSTWAAATNPHIIRVMQGSAPFVGMSYKDTLGRVPKFEEILEKFPVTGGVNSGVSGVKSRVVKLEKVEGGEDENSDMKTKEAAEEFDLSKVKKEDKMMLQIYFDHWCRKLKAVIHACAVCS